MFFDYSSSYTGINILTYSDMYSLMISVNRMATLTFSIIMIAIPFQHATIVFLCPLSHIVSLFVQKSRLRNSGTTVFIVFKFLSVLAADEYLNLFNVIRCHFSIIPTSMILRSFINSSHCFKASRNAIYADFFLINQSG